ncbi:MAG: phage minor head protein [Aeromonas veronii]
MKTIGAVSLTPLPPKEAIAYLEQKGYKIGFDWQDVWQAEHQAAFTVAKVMQQDLLEEIRKEVARALAEGTTYETFAKRLTPIIKDKGWWGKRPMVDPLTGEEREVQLGSPRRLKVIYDTNLRTAHSEGQWERIQDSKEAFPYLEYDGNNSEHSRLLHSQWDKLVLPVDDPFWLAHFPVKEWGCKCRAIPRSARQLERQGKQVSAAPKVPTKMFTNKRTGEVQQVPQGVHPAFHYPPGGRRAALNRRLTEQLESTTPAIARASVSEMVRGPAFAAWFKRPAGAFPVAYLERSAAAELGARTQLVSLSEETLAKQQRHHKELTPDEYRWVQVAIDEGRMIEDAKDGSAIYILEDAGYVTVIRATRTGKALFMTSFRRLSSNEVKRDVEIQRLLDKQKKG